VKIFVVYIIFILSFSKGVLELMGISETILQLIIESLIVVLFLMASLNVVKTKTIKGPGLVVFFILVGYSVISFLLNEVSGIQFFFFLRKLILYILFFYSLFNLKIPQADKQRVIKLLTILFIIQIPAAFIKLVVLGGTLEKIVGTMSINEGSLATIMPLFPIAYLINIYLEDNKIKNLILIGLFFFIGLMSNKLGIIMYIIVLFVLLTYLNSNSKYYLINLKFIKKMAINSFFLILIIGLFMSLNPRANPENKVGGSININYLIEFTENYQTLDQEDGTDGDGRFDAPFVSFERLSNAGIKNVFFGFGPGDIVKSSFFKFDNPLLEKYNIGYGGRIGLVWILMQLGVLGVIIFLVFHLYLLNRVYKIYRLKRKSMEIKILTSTVLGFFFIFFVDFFSYSTEMIENPGMAMTYFFGIFYILTLRQCHLKKSINE